MTAPETLTFGCRLNAYESEVMRAEADAAGQIEVVQAGIRGQLLRRSLEVALPPRLCARIDSRSR